MPRVAAESAATLRGAARTTEWPAKLPHISSTHALLATVAVAFMFVGCGREEVPASDAGSGDGPEASTAQGPPQRIAGYFVPDGETPRLEACEGEARFPIVGPAMPDLLVLHQSLTSGQEPGEPIFVDVLARIVPSQAGPEAASDSALQVLDLRRAAFEGFGCRSVEGDLLVRGGGYEPFWSVELYRGRATFRTPEGERALEADPPELSGRGWRVTGSMTGGDGFELVLHPGGCVDSMSGAWSHLTATLSFGGETWSGCGFLGAAAELWD